VADFTEFSTARRTKRKPKSMKELSTMGGCRFYRH
jgi:hypothetical protein